MIPNKNQKIKCFMRTGLVLEGFVEEWSDSTVVLKSLDQKSLMILHQPNQDIFLTKIILEDEVLEEAIEKTKIVPPNSSKIINEKLKEIQETDPETRGKNITQLKNLVAEQEKEMIASKTKEHFGSPGNAKFTSYSGADFLFKKDK